MLRLVFCRNIQKFSGIAFVSKPSNILKNQVKAITYFTQSANSPTLGSHNLNKSNIYTRNYSAEASDETVKSKKQKKNPPAPDDVGRLDLRVGKIVEISQVPDSESLYTTKVDCGEPAPRKVLAGLAKSVPIEELQNRLVVVLCNLKPSKMRGHLSEAMIMVATSPDGPEPLMPPQNATPGDLVNCEGYARDPVKNPRSKQKLYDPIAEDLVVRDDNIAYYKDGQLYVPEKGAIITKKLKNVPIT